MGKTTITPLINWCLAIPQKAHEKKNSATNKDNFEKTDSTSSATVADTHATEEHPPDHPAKEHAGKTTHETTAKATPEKGSSPKGPERRLGAE